jgi:hypothetical protein
MAAAGGSVHEAVKEPGFGLACRLAVRLDMASRQPGNRFGCGDARAREPAPHVAKKAACWPHQPSRGLAAGAAGCCRDCRRFMRMSLRTMMQAGPAKANELFARLSETSDGAVKTREKLLLD